MADNTQQTPNIVTNTFSKGMVKDYNETFVGEGLWTHARNAVNNTSEGDSRRSLNSHSVSHMSLDSHSHPSPFK